MNNLIIHPSILEKLTSKHNVTRQEVEQCFHNKIGNLLEDTREQNKTTPPTRWFVAITNKKRLLKIVFIEHEGKIHLKTAYEANKDEIDIYSNFALK